MEVGNPSKPVKATIIPPATGVIHSAGTQCIFLQGVASRSNQSTKIGQRAYNAAEQFRLMLEKHCQRILRLTEVQNGQTEFPAESVILEYVGGYMSGLATTNSCVDFLLHSPNSTIDIASFENDIPGKVASALHNTGLGANLLTRAGAPMIVGCQLPTSQLHKALVARANEVMAKMRQYGEAVHNSQLMPEEPISNEELLRRLEIGVQEGRFEQERDLAFIQEFRSAYEAVNGTATFNGVRVGGFPSESAKARLALARTGLSVLNNILLRFNDLPNPNLNIPRINVGIRYTIRFADHRAILNTKLLRCYNRLDPRVQGMITFVKTWANHRDIDDADRGTLSSFGYTLMVIHYLVHIAKPPVLRNLQLEPLYFRTDNHDVQEDMDNSARFWIEEEWAIERAIRTGLPSANKEPVGSLLRGFFEYFDNLKGKSRENRFAWSTSVISLRSSHGIVRKEAKGWTRTETRYAPSYYPWEKPIEMNSRYLLCIEDPFDQNVNVAQFVTFTGTCKMKDEFKRAHRIYENVGRRPRGEPWNLMEVVQPEPFRGWLYYGRRVTSPINLPMSDETDSDSEKENELNSYWNRQLKKPQGSTGGHPFSSIPQHPFMRVSPSTVVAPGQMQVSSKGEGTDLNPPLQAPVLVPHFGGSPPLHHGNPAFRNVPPAMKPSQTTTKVTPWTEIPQILKRLNTGRNESDDAQRKTTTNAVPSNHIPSPQLDDEEKLDPLIDAGLKEIESRGTQLTKNNFKDPFATASTTYANWPTPKTRRRSLATQSNLFVAPNTSSRTAAGPFPPPLASPTSPISTDFLRDINMSLRPRPLTLDRRASAEARLSTLSSIPRPRGTSITPLYPVPESTASDLRSGKQPSQDYPVMSSLVSPISASDGRRSRSSSTVFSPLSARTRSSDVLLANLNFQDASIPDLAPDPSLWGSDGLEMSNDQNKKREEFEFVFSSRRGSRS